MRGSTVDGLAVHEGVAIRDGHGIHVAGVHKIDVTNVGVEHVRVTDERVAHVDSFNEVMTATEPGEKRFAKAERKPADSETKPTAEKADKCGAIDRKPKSRTRAPAPTASEIVPAPIVVRRKAPGRIINPGPAPRADPVPISVAVRSPANSNFARIPNVAIFGLIAPVAIVVEIIVADHVARNVFCRDGAVFLQVALGSPAVKTVGTGSLFNTVLNVFGAVEFSALTRMDFVGLAAGGDFAFAANHGHAGGVAVLSNVNAKSARFLDSECQIRSVHFIEIALTKFADAEIDAAFSEAHLRDSLIEIEEGKGGHASEMDGGGTGLQFGAGIFVDPN